MGKAICLCLSFHYAVINAATFLFEARSHWRILRQTQHVTQWKFFTNTKYLNKNLARHCQNTFSFTGLCLFDPLTRGSLSLDPAGG